MKSRTPVYGDVFEIRVGLRDIEPAIWRRLRVPADVSLGVLHEVIQLAFGWTDSHLHEFSVGGIDFGATDAEDERFRVDENAAPLGAVAREGSTFDYSYDFGDCWDHDVAVERVSSEENAAFICTGGERACPPEDCGGVPGYANLLTALADRRHPEHAEMKRWAPRGFDPERFDLAAVNAKLGRLSKRLGRRGRVAIGQA